MSEFHVTVVELGKIGKHPDADKLRITSVFKYPVIIGDDPYFQPGAKAVFIPADAMVPVSNPLFDWLAPKANAEGYARIRATRLRGRPSMGILVPADPSWNVGRDVRNELGIKKYENPAEDFNPKTSGLTDSGPSYGVPVYDIEGLRRYPQLFKPGEEVFVSEKIHGCNARFIYAEGRLHTGSRTQFKKEDANCEVKGMRSNVWGEVARRYSLEEKLKTIEDYVLLGEIYGHGIQDLTYGLKGPDGPRFMAFDLLDMKTREYMPVWEFRRLMQDLNIPVVPWLYVGPYREDLITALAEGPSLIPGANHVREGVVIKPTRERFDFELGRVFLKLAGEGYLTRKEAN